MTIVGAAAVGLVAIVGLFTVVWVFSVTRRDASIADVWWGPGFALLAWLYCALLAGVRPRPLLLATLLTLWAARLAWHIGRRHRGADEDRRYQAMRARHGQAFWWRSLFLVFWLQATLVWLIALPALVVSASSGAGLTILDAVGIVIFAAGFSIEAIGDEQLRRFMASPANRGKVLDTGLWRYSRHPNYFGDAVVWWGVYVLAASAPGGWMAFISPLLMTFLLARVSGVTLLEEHLRTSKPAYANYVIRTSAFMLWFPKRNERARPP